ncbi:MAG: MFS transporter [Caldilineaceae bacterium]|nr:MFS transporter [Caldilineaceae bacterium]
MFSALLPTLQDKFDLREGALAALVAIMVFSSSLAQPVLGALADRLGRRKIAATGVVLNAALLSLVGVVPTLYLLVTTMVLGGLGAAALHPASSSLANTASSGRQQLAVSLFSAGGMLGVSLGPVVVLILVENFGLAASGWLMIPGIVLGLLMLLVILEGAAVDAPAFQMPTQRPKILDVRLLATPLGGLVMTAVLVNLVAITFSSTVPLWLVSEHGYMRDAALLGWTLTAFSLAAAVGGVVAGWSSRYVEPQRLALVTLLAAAVPLLALFHVEPGSTLYFVAVVMAGALTHAGMPLFLVAAQEQAPHAMATASGLLMGFAASGAGLLYIGVGWLQENIGLVAAMQLGFLTVIPAALLAGWLLRRRQQLPHAGHVDQQSSLANLDGCVMAGC